MGSLDDEIESLYRTRQRAFQQMLASVTGNVESARDVVQEAFARALRQQHTFRREGSLEGWVWRIAFRVAIRSKGARELAEHEVPAVAFVDGERDPTLAAALRRLPPQRRLIVFLRYFADLPYAEIGEILGIAEGTVAASLAKAHAQLAETLAPEEAGV